MRLLWERKKKGTSYYLFGIPIIILIITVNIVLITWFIHLLYYLFSDSPNPMSLLEWANHVYELVKRLIDQIHFPSSYLHSLPLCIFYKRIIIGQASLGYIIPIGSIHLTHALI